VLYSFSSLPSNLEILLMLFVFVFICSFLYTFHFSKANNKASLFFSASLCASLIHGVSARIINFNLFSSSLQLSFLFFLQVSKQWRFFD
jgi:hypothetical protein